MLTNSLSWYHKVQNVLRITYAEHLRDEYPSEATNQRGIAMSWQTKVTGINVSSRNFLSSSINED